MPPTSSLSTSPWPPPPTPGGSGSRTTPTRSRWRRYPTSSGQRPATSTPSWARRAAPAGSGPAARRLAARGLTVCGDAVFAGLHKQGSARGGQEELRSRGPAAARDRRRVPVHLPDQSADQRGGALAEAAEIDPAVAALVSGTDELARTCWRSSG